MIFLNYLKKAVNKLDKLIIAFMITSPSLHLVYLQTFLAFWKGYWLRPINYSPSRITRISNFTLLLSLHLFSAVTTLNQHHSTPPPSPIPQMLLKIHSEPTFPLRSPLLCCHFIRPLPLRSPQSLFHVFVVVIHNLLSLKTSPFFSSFVPPFAWLCKQNLWHQI